MLTQPRALLLDFGGVIADAPSLPPAPPEVVQRVHQLVDGALPTDRIIQAMTDGDRAYARWRDKVSDQDRPVEISHVQLWDDFITADWPEPARAAVRREATALCYAMTWRPKWTVLPGIPEVLRRAAERGWPVAIVSNTLCGAAHRDFLDQAGISDLFAVQLYSDEIGVRKPNPEMAWRAAAEIGVPVEQCWFVGDSPMRDVGCARRAGAGAMVLIRSGRTARETEIVSDVADATVDDGHGLLELLF